MHTFNGRSSDLDQVRRGERIVSYDLNRGVETSLLQLHDDVGGHGCGRHDDKAVDVLGGHLYAQCRKIDLIDLDGIFGDNLDAIHLQVLHHLVGEYDVGLVVGDGD